MDSFNPSLDHFGNPAAAEFYATTPMMPESWPHIATKQTFRAASPQIQTVQSRPAVSEFDLDYDRPSQEQAALSFSPAPSTTEPPFQDFPPLDLPWPEIGCLPPSPLNEPNFYPFFDQYPLVLPDSSFHLAESPLKRQALSPSAPNKFSTPYSSSSSSSLPALSLFEVASAFPSPSPIPIPIPSPCPHPRPSPSAIDNHQDMSDEPDLDTASCTDSKEEVKTNPSSLSSSSAFSSSSWSSSSSSSSSSPPSSSSVKLTVSSRQNATPITNEKELRKLYRAETFQGFIRPATWREKKNQKEREKAALHGSDPQADDKRGASLLLQATGDLTGAQAVVRLLDVDWQCRVPLYYMGSDANGGRQYEVLVSLQDEVKTNPLDPSWPEVIRGYSLGWQTYMKMELSVYDASGALVWSAKVPIPFKGKPTALRPYCDEKLAPRASRVNNNTVTGGGKRKAHEL